MDLPQFRSRRPPHHRPRRWGTGRELCSFFRHGASRMGTAMRKRKRSFSSARRAITSAR